jgi:hypothetical protein
MPGGALEWARVSPSLVIVATADKAFRHTLLPSLGSDVFASPMAGPGTVETTRRLLDGAIGAAATAAPRGDAAPPLTPLRWIWRLAGYHCTTTATPGLMSAASARFAQLGRRTLAAWAAEKAREETGHDLLALRDIEALGYDAARVVEVLVPPASRALVEHFQRYVAAPDPIGCVGYSYVLERLAIARDAARVAAVQAALPAGVDATRCLRVHSGVGSDVAHVEETVAMVAALPAAGRAAVARLCHETALLFYAKPAAPAPTDAEIAAKIAGLSLSRQA